MLFSATVPKWVKKLVKQYLNDPVVSLAPPRLRRPARTDARAGALRPWACVGGLTDGLILWHGSGGRST